MLSTKLVLPVVGMTVKHLLECLIDLWSLFKTFCYLFLVAFFFYIFECLSLCSWRPTSDVGQGIQLYTIYTRVDVVLMQASSYDEPHLCHTSIHVQNFSYPHCKKFLFLIGLVIRAQCKTLPRVSCSECKKFPRISYPRCKKLLI